MSKNRWAMLFFWTFANDLVKMIEYDADSKMQNAYQYLSNPINMFFCWFSVWQNRRSSGGFNYQEMGLKLFGHSSDPPKSWKNMWFPEGNSRCLNLDFLWQP